MDSPIATVLDVSGHNALVRVEASVCPRCAAGKGCGAGIFGQSRASTTLTAHVAGGLRIAAGDRVRLSLADENLMRAALYAYGAPLLGLLLASGLVYLLAEAPNDAVALIWALVGLGIGGAAGGFLARRDACVSTLTPTISGRAGPEEAEMAP